MEEIGEPRNVVFDTGAVLQAALSSRGPARRSIRLMEEGKTQVFVSPRLLSEYEDVLTRPSVRRKNPSLTEARAREMLALFHENAHIVFPVRKHLEYPRDPNDEAVLNLAIEVQADYLISRDTDLLDLDDDAGFRRRYPFLRIVDPVTFLRELAREAPLEQ